MLVGHLVRHGAPSVSFDGSTHVDSAQIIHCCSEAGTLSSPDKEVPVRRYERLVP